MNIFYFFSPDGNSDLVDLNDNDDDDHGGDDDDDKDYD